MLTEYKIRPINPNEITLLEKFVYEAIFIPEGVSPPPFDIIYKPELRVFFEDFGKPDDHCLVAETGGEIIGMVWTRIINGDVKGFGYVDDETPEFGISLIKEYRGRGIGAQLMLVMLDLLRSKGYKQTSLAVQKENYAVKMYKAVGFKIVKELEQEYLMICDLQKKKRIKY